MLDGPTLLGMQRLVRRMPIGDQLIDLILRLVRAGRPENRDLPEPRRADRLGPGPARQPGLMLAVRVRALLDGRLAPSVEDVATLARPGAPPPHGRHLRRPGRGHHAWTTSSARLCRHVA